MVFCEKQANNTNHKVKKAVNSDRLMNANRRQCYKMQFFFPKCLTVAPQMTPKPFIVKNHQNKANDQLLVWNNSRDCERLGLMFKVVDKTGDFNSVTLAVYSGGVTSVIIHRDTQVCRLGTRTFPVIQYNGVLHKSTVYVKSDIFVSFWRNTALVACSASERTTCLFRLQGFWGRHKLPATKRASMNWDLQILLLSN